MFPARLKLLRRRGARTVKVATDYLRSLLVGLFLILGIPMSWQLAALSQEVGWISSWSISVLPDKLQRIIGQLEHISKCARPSEEPAVSHWQSAMAHLGMALLETDDDPVI